MKVRFKTSQLLVALTASTVAPLAAAQPTVINISGATLFRNFFTSNNASSHDFLDVDGDGRVTGSSPGVVDQLGQPHFLTDAWNGIADGNVGSNASSNAHWRVQYKAVGSVNGLQDLINYRSAAFAATTAPTFLGGNDYDDTGLSPIGDPATVNRTQFALGTNPGPVGPGVASNPAFVPYLSNGVGGQRIDIAPLDVPTVAAVQSGSAGNAFWGSSPNSNGYGQNQITSATGFSNQLITTTPTQTGDAAVNFNTSSPDGNTVFDTQVAWSPVAFITNRGVGWEDRDSDGNVGDVSKSELQHLFVSGRTASGENLFAVTRDSGSGTRNAAMNSIGVDPSWGRGDNQNDGGRSSANDNLGNLEWTNRQSSSRLADVVETHRLAVGYTGLQGSSAAAADRLSGKFEILNIQNDIVSGFVDDGTFEYVRPSTATVLNTDDARTGYQVGGAQTFATVGDPRSQSEIGGEAGNTNPQMENSEAAAYVNNITRSIEAFVSAPADPANFGTPGELLAAGFTLVQAIDALPNVSGGNYEEFVAQAPVASLQAYTLANSLLNTSQNPGTYGTVNSAGLSGNRASGGTYSDDAVVAAAGGTAGTNWVDNNGTVLGEIHTLAARNEIAGDFNGDGARNLDDAERMVDAVLAVEAGTLADRAAWAAAPGAAANDGDLIMEVVGDFDGNGSFDREDLRYWADGLAMTTTGGRVLDRKAGFMAIDTEFGGNTFGTTFGGTLSTVYASGDSRGDIAGSTSGANAGGLFQGHDSVIDQQDIDAVFAEFVGLDQDSTGGVEWSNLNEAVFSDLSADMTGDLVINSADVDELVEDILGTEYGDANLDGSVDLLDFGVWRASFLGGSGDLGWADGSFNGDLAVDLVDFGIWRASFLGTGGSPALAALATEEAFALATVPEPASLALLGMGGLLAMRRRRQA